jgi:ABC-type transporter Mla subunit MlaD
VQIGRVAELRFLDSLKPSQGVRVVARIRDEFNIPSNATAKVIPAMLGLGSGRIEISLDGDAREGAPVPRKDGRIPGRSVSPFDEVLSGSAVSSVEKILENVEEFSRSLTPVADDLHELIVRRTMAEVDVSADDDVTANLSTAIQRFDQTIKSANKLVSDEGFQSDLRATAENLRMATDDARAGVGELRESVAELRATARRIGDDLGRVLAKVEEGVDNANLWVTRTGEGLAPSLENFARMTSDLQRAAQLLSEGEGTAVLMLRDPRLYEELVLTVERIGDAAETLKALVDPMVREGYLKLKVRSTVGDIRVKEPLD